MKTITRDVELTVMTCGNCGVTFAMPEAMRAEAQADGDTWYCPNGHPRVYRESDSDRLRKQLDIAQKERDRANARATHERDQRQAAERSASAYKGQLTRARKRAGAGVCPVTECHRTVRQLADHMATKHPDFKA